MRQSTAHEAKLGIGDVTTLGSVVMMVQLSTGPSTTPTGLRRGQCP
jgi:hypothetical protein